ncbi:hypothetical protein [Luteibacter yeojuensis]|uniref:Uncharacterized protein n=1 Tax=Luteibacter yeojuensis TaxID=345309 RepID=A0A7X5QT84_9GAMM|nr:hypothetical protein [Luteibacter yeojuensis]NID14981.1 hypothetical protein [Luteibacter yeojuensis]
MITTLAGMANDGSVSCDVTLAVGGILVSGYVVSADKYYEHHPVAKAFGDGIKQLMEQEKAENGNDEGSPPTMFIHLRNARYWHPGGNAIPTGSEGIFVRVKIEDVSAFNFGSISKD